MPTAEQLSLTLERIYAAAADASLWEEALRAIEDYTGSTGAVLNLVPKHPQAPPICLAGSFSEDNCAEYATDFMWRCPRIAFAEANPGIPIHYDNMILSESEMDRDATYEWYGKHGLRYYVAGWIGETADHRGYMSIQRSRRQGHAEPEQVEQFGLILRHMSQAMALAAKLGTLEHQCRFGFHLLDALPYAVIVIDADGAVLLTNGRADRLLARGDGLLIINNRLQCRLGPQQPLIDRLIATALSPVLVEKRGGWTRVGRSSGRRDYVALVSGLPATEGLLDSFRPKAIVIITDPDDEQVPAERALQDLFGLTPAEARLAVTLAGGHSVESASAKLGVSRETSRSQLKHVFRKLGINRQQDLARLLGELVLVDRMHHPNWG